MQLNAAQSKKISETMISTKVPNAAGFKVAMKSSTPKEKTPEEKKKAEASAKLKTAKNRCLKKASEVEELSKSLGKDKHFLQKTLSKSIMRQLNKAKTVLKDQLQYLNDVESKGKIDGTVMGRLEKISGQQDEMEETIKIAKNMTKKGDKKSPGLAI